MIETICHHHPISKEAAREKAIALLDRVKIPNPESRIDDYPHEFSLGMCQRYDCTYLVDEARFSDCG